MPNLLDSTVEKKDNDFLRDKVELRVRNLPEGDITVLDCFSGKGLIWRGVKKLTNRKIRWLPIDIRDDLTGFHLDGRNEDFLKSLNLEKFSVIDLDAYGVPYKQLKILFERKYRGTVFVTFIQLVAGIMPYELLKEVGFSREMIEKTPTLFGRRGWDYFKEWLALNGVTEIRHRSKGRKHYLCFKLNGVAAPVLGSGTRPARRAANRV